LRKAVRGMLPKNRLRDDRMGRLKCFEGLAHPYKENVLQLQKQTSSAVAGSQGDLTAVFKCTITFNRGKGGVLEHGAAL